jgi:hypothetical protein
VLSSQPAQALQEAPHAKFFAAVSRCANELEHFLARFPFFTLVIFTLAYIPYVIARTLQKPLWYDELATLAISRLPSLHALFGALYQGFEATPPFIYLLIHWSTRLPGNELITARLPGMFGFWLCCVCLYLFLSRRGWRTSALLGLLFPFVTGLLYYATEARPYGMVIGLSALSLLAWQHALEPNGQRIIWLAVLFLSLAGTIYSHWYGVLTPFALLCGEICIWLESRRLDWLRIGVIIGSYAVLIFLIPIMKAETHRLGVNWAQPYLQTTIEFYLFALTPFLFPMLAIATVVALLQRMGVRDRDLTPRGSLHFEELVAAFAFFLIPFMGYVLGLIVRGYTGRYTIASLVGMAVLFWWLANHYFRGALSASFIAVIVLCCFIGVNELRDIRRAIRYSLDMKLQDVFPFPFPDNLPIVVQDPRDYLQMAHYAKPELAKRLYYLADPNISLQYTGSVGLDISLTDLSKILPLHVVPYQSFLESHRQFLLFWGKPQEEDLVGWQLPKLYKDGARLELVEQSKQRLLFCVYPR